MKQTYFVEGDAKISAYEGLISKKLPVFYNPVMKFNRDLSVLLLNAIDTNELHIADPLAGSGIRSVRFMLELHKNKIATIALNDASSDSINLVKKNFRLNNIKRRGIVSLHNEDATDFLLSQNGFDYIDIDPFGSPNHFLDAAIKRLSRRSILAVTATDTAPLCGTYENACKRKYWAKPLRNELMHEIGLRILIRKVQLVAAQFDKALTPICSYFKDHYFRIFFKVEKSKKGCDALLKQHKYFLYNTKTTEHVVSDTKKKDWLCAGPIWIGSLFDKKVISKMYKDCTDSETKKVLQIMVQESKQNIVGFYDLHKLGSKTKIGIPKTQFVLKLLKKNGFTVFQTHFSNHAIKTNANVKEIVKLLKKKN